MYVEILPTLKKQEPVHHPADHYSRELDKINELLNKFAYSCSHSLKGPIVTIQGLIGLLEMERSNFPQMDYLDAMKHWAEKMKVRVHRLDNYQFNPRYKLAEKLYCTMYPNSVMESKEHLLRQFVFGILDLKDLVHNFSNLVESKIPEIENPQELNYLDLIESKLHSISNFVRAVENFSKNKNEVIRKVEVDMEQLTDQALRELQRECPHQHIDVEVFVEQPVALVCDPVRIKLVLKHLLRNAIKFHEPLRNKPYIEIIVKVAHDDMLIEIIDNGQGIIPECQAKIFDVFYRASENSNGCGLGLFLVKEVTGRLQGDIKFFSQVGIGSIFIVRMPNFLSESLTIPQPSNEDESNTEIPVLKIA